MDKPKSGKRLSLDQVWSSVVKKAVNFSQMAEEDRLLFRGFLYRKEHHGYECCASYKQSLYFFVSQVRFLHDHEIYPDWYTNLLYVAKAGCVAEDLLSLHCNANPQTKAIRDRVQLMSDDELSHCFQRMKEAVSLSYQQAVEQRTRQFWETKSPVDPLLQDYVVVSENASAPKDEMDGWESVSFFNEGRRSSPLVPKETNLGNDLGV